MRPPPNETHHSDGSVTIEGRTYSSREYAALRGYPVPHRSRLPVLLTLALVTLAAAALVLSR